MILRHMPLKTEAVEKRLLHYPPLAHHRPNLLHPAEGNQRDWRPDQAEFFNTIGRKPAIEVPDFSLPPAPPVLMTNDPSRHFHNRRKKGVAPYSLLSSAP